MEGDHQSVLNLYHSGLALFVVVVVVVAAVVVVAVVV